MKYTLYINTLFYLITLLIPIYNLDLKSGLLSQFFLGAFQLILGIIYIVITSNNKIKLQKETSIYWLLVILYFISLPLVYKLNINKDMCTNIFLVIIPMLIGLYNLFVNYKIQKS